MTFSLPLPSLLLKLPSCSDEGLTLETSASRWYKFDPLRLIWYEICLFHFLTDPAPQVLWKLQQGTSILHDDVALLISVRILRLLEVPSFIIDWSSFHFKYSLIHACSLIKHFVKRNTLQREGGVKFPQNGLLTEGGWRWIPTKRTTDRGRLVLNAHKTDLWNIKGAWCQLNKFPQNGLLTEGG